jgi:hypothetical protein
MEQCAEAQSKPSTDIILHTKEIFVDNDIIQRLWHRRGDFFFAKHEKREGVFSSKAQKWYVHKFLASQRNILH